MSRPLAMDTLLREILHTRHVSEHSPSKLAEIAQYLIRHELKPGGPYQFEGSIDTQAVNAHIQRVFIAGAQPLVKASLRDKTLTQSTRASTQLLYRRAVIEALPNFATPEGDLVKSILEKIKSTDLHGEICQLSLLFYKSLTAKQQAIARCTRTSLDHLAIANILTWCTYSLVDTLLDEHTIASNSSHAVPIVLILQRIYTAHYLAAGTQEKQLLELFTIVDQANLQELELRKSISFNDDHTNIIIHSLPDLSSLRELMPRKSIAHTLGPLTVIQHSTAASRLEVTAAMHTYCAAKQFQDDLHDWADDLYDGQLTYSIGLLFTAAHVKPGTYNLSELTYRLQQAYWDTVLEQACREIEQLIADSAASLERSVVMPGSQFVTKIITPIAYTARQARKRHAYEASFLTAFTHKQ